ncbi:F-box domain containing protein [Cryptosporidium tyzzeri]|nr:F-box domain containing protein [Cryptosporidium tyzzeri]
MVRSEFVVNWNSILNEESSNERSNSGSSNTSEDELNRNESKHSSDNENNEETKLDGNSDKNNEVKEEVKPVIKREITIVNVTLLEVFSKLSLRAKRNLFDFVEDKYLLQLRLVCKMLNRYCDGYIRYSLKNCYFFNVPLTRMTMDFWFAAIKFFFLEAGRNLPLNRFKYSPIVAALKHNHKLLPVSVDQMKSHVVVTLDKLLAEHIVFCDHQHPQPHTCDTRLEIKGQSKVFFDEIDIIRFVRQYFMHLEVMDDELIRGSRQLTRYRLAMYFYEFLKSIKMLTEKGNGVFKLSRIEYLVNTGTILRHRIWHQLYASWGSSINVKKSIDANSGKEDKDLGNKSSEQHDSSLSGGKPKRLSDGSARITKTTNMNKSSTSNSKSGIGSNNPDDLVIEVFLTIADHFQWDS